MGAVIKPIINTLLFVQLLSLLLTEANVLPSSVCSIKLSELAECFPAIAGGTSPTVKCCNVLHKAKLSCLCAYKKDFAKYGVDPKNALALPKRCGIKVPRACTFS
ncbi:Bifunctional inhibitor/lipid-transfer protein/seed storage 2S albumin superfamily protein [Striga hermonthica]|uniref:Bifunctional inhibitor/lipid-transfer protein/seed storage 2S albumin superfamily protein n=1 Tax=Striga hermonthica TaxID=68872 RepID=A0A9N7NG08_STRHE|nr:Bifunctional inhibitor/lipid-transfer protein/seed storage 2S albumin superfamily protein [Striga hermonthica]